MGKRSNTREKGENKRKTEKHWKTGENVEKHGKHRENKGNAQKQQGNFYICWGHVMESYMRY